jgi:hypothetical protein
LITPPFIFDGYDPDSLIPLNFTNLLPQNSIVAIAVPLSSDETGGGGATAPEPSTSALMIVGFAGLGLTRWRRARGWA